MPDKENVVSTGNRLKQTRIEKGFTLEDVHKKTKIHPNILRAIEEDRLSSISPVYVKGFLKIYCQFLGLNPEDYIKDYRQIRTRTEVVPRQEEKKQEAVLSKNPVVKMPKFRLPSPRVLKAAGIAIVGIIAIILIFRLGKFIAVKISQIRSERPRQTQVTKSEKRSVASPAKAIKSTAAISVNAPSLGVRAKEDCYMQVKLDGKVIFQGRLKKGRTENWTAKQKIELSLNNAAAAELEVNNSMIPAIGRKGQAKKVVITREGMSISK